MEISEGELKVAEWVKKGRQVSLLGSGNLEALEHCAGGAGQSVASFSGRAAGVSQGRTS